jgi:hypothetical protein
LLSYFSILWTSLHLSPNLQWPWIKNGQSLFGCFTLMLWLFYIIIVWENLQLFPNLQLLFRKNWQIPFDLWFCLYFLFFVFYYLIFFQDFFIFCLFCGRDKLRFIWVKGLQAIRTSIMIKSAIVLIFLTAFLAYLRVHWFLALLIYIKF